MNTGVTWNPPVSHIASETVKWGKIHGIAAVQRVAMLMADRIEHWMKANARWQDRTGDARQTLRAWAVMMAEGARIMLAHGVPYGRYLETMQGGRFAILAPAVQFWAPQFIELIKRNSPR